MACKQQKIAKTNLFYFWFFVFMILYFYVFIVRIIFGRICYGTTVSQTTFYNKYHA